MRFRSISWGISWVVEQDSLNKNIETNSPKRPNPMGPGWSIGDISKDHHPYIKHPYNILDSPWTHWRNFLTPTSKTSLNHRQVTPETSLQHPSDIFETAATRL